MLQRFHRSAAPICRILSKRVVGAAIALVIGAACGAASAADQSHSDYDTAVRELMQERYAVAFDRFSKLADAGHEPSALMALAIVRYRPTALGTQCSATPSQLRHWTVLAQGDGPQHASAISLGEGDQER